MAPQKSRSLAESAFAPYFSRLRTIQYADTTSRTTAAIIQSIAWNPIGSLIATGAKDRTLRIWNPEKNNVKYSTELRGHTGAVEKVAFNPTSETELASCAVDGTVRLWDVRSKASIGEVKVGDPKEEGSAISLVWKPDDGAELVVGRRDDVLVKIDRRTLTATPFPRQPIQTNQCLFNHSGQYLFLTQGDGSIAIKRYLDWETVYTFNAHTSSCLAISLDPYARWLAVGASDALITLWDTKDWLCHRSFSRYMGPIKSVSFSFDGQYITGGTDEDKELYIYHTETGTLVYNLETPGYPSSVAWHPNRYVLAYAGDVQGLRIVGGIGGGLI